MVSSLFVADGEIQTSDEKNTTAGVLGVWPRHTAEQQGLPSSLLLRDKAPADNNSSERDYRVAHREITGYRYTRQSNQAGIFLTPSAR